MTPNADIFKGGNFFNQFRLLKRSREVFALEGAQRTEGKGESKDKWGTSSYIKQKSNILKGK